MLPSALTDMLAALAQCANDRGQAELLKRFGRALLDMPDAAAQLLEETATVTGSGAREENLAQLMSAALDEARMARENGQKRGAAFIGVLEAHLDHLQATDRVSFKGTLAVSSSWVRAGLTPPECLSSDKDRLSTSIPYMDGVNAGDLDGLFESLFGNLIEAGGGNASALHAMFAELLPTIPAGARGALIRVAVARPDELFAELGCAWLLDPSGQVRSAAADGLSDRLQAGRLSTGVLARLTMMRSWLTDEAVRDRVDALVRDTLRKGVGQPNRDVAPKVHRVIASMVDGSGAQSMAAAVQSSGSRHVAVVLLKQGFGVKDAYVVPCASATEQRRIMAGITEDIEAYDVPRDYLAQAIGLALSEGLERGMAPVPGLVDVAQSCALTGLRPIPAALEDILVLADPEARVAGLSVQARGSLIMSSKHWEEDYPMLSSWFEDSDETVEALEGARSRAALQRGMWRILEGRRQHWAMIIARNALLLAAAGKDDADAFTAVAAALAEGRDLKKTPVMHCIVEQSIQAWADRRGASDDMYDVPEVEFTFGAPTNLPMPGIRAEKTGELGRLLHPAGLTEPWIDGYLIAVCTAPEFVSPPDWVEPLLHLVSPALDTGKKMERLVELLMLRYNATLSRFRGPNTAPLIPGDIPLLPIWADGYLTAWEATKPCWPAKALGPQGKAIRKLLEAATEGRIDRTGFAETIPAWLRQRFADQRR
jgi:hypothetical protein